MSRLRHVRISKQTKRSVAGFITFVIVLTLVLQGVGLKPIHAVQSLFSRVGTAIGTTFTYIRTYDEFVSELKDLRERVISLSVDAEKADELEKENKELRSLLSMKSDTLQANIQVAEVLTRSLTDQRAQFVIYAGSDDGIEKGSAVIIEDGMLIGTIEEVRKRVSIVRLITDQRSRIASKIPTSDTIGVSEGQKGSLLKFSFIPQHVRLEVNDLVLTSGLEEGIPQGLVIGLITKIKADDTEPFQSATVEPIIDFRLYQTVGIVMSPDEL